MLKINIEVPYNIGDTIFYIRVEPYLAKCKHCSNGSNSSKWKGCKLKDNVLFSPSKYTVYLYDLEGNPSGELEPFDHFNLNSRYKNITFFSQDDEEYFFCMKLE